MCAHLRSRIRQDRDDLPDLGAIGPAEGPPHSNIDDDAATLKVPGPWVAPGWADPLQHLRTEPNLGPIRPLAGASSYSCGGVI